MLQKLSVNSGLKAVGAAVFCWIYAEPDALFGVRSAPIVPKFVPKFLCCASLPTERSLDADLGDHRYHFSRHIRIDGSARRAA